MTINLKYTTYTYNGWTYIGNVEEEEDNAKMWHSIEAPSGAIDSADNEFGPYEVPTYDDFIKVVKVLERKDQ